MEMVVVCFGEEEEGQGKEKEEMDQVRQEEQDEEDILNTQTQRPLAVFAIFFAFISVDVIVHSDVTGPRIISEVKFIKPQDWKESNLRCNVDNPDRDNIIRPEDKPKMKAYKPCKKIEYI
ncbi:hypothetical protein PoB_003997300 [Plakobranchus ocellatus]|uniref:Uncharacterized protein n=1 Tax=Plakobranchus ocellatus TaxID=259542 RepID=A0AAV4B3Y8_9GAST|nr:hypothetical protein PoB_003997300 [Plakobranchus ocellatus]